MKRKILNILVVIFTVGVIYEVYNYVKEVNTTSTNKVLETIQISDNLKEAKQIALMQQKKTSHGKIKEQMQVLGQI